MEPVVESVSRYQFLDDDKHAKVYIPLEGVGRLADSDISSEFNSQSFCVNIENYKPNAILRLSIAQLEGDVGPDSAWIG